jgi:hypothetical protein
LQMLAYLLLSASSAVPSRNDVWMSRSGGDQSIHQAYQRFSPSASMAFLILVWRG